MKMLNVNPISTPMSTSSHLLAYQGELIANPTLYHSIVEALQYDTITWLEISFSINKVYY